MLWTIGTLKWEHAHWLGIVALATTACGQGRIPHSASAPAVSPAGRWVGIATFQGAPALGTTLVLDSTNGGWSGRLLLADDTSSIAFASVVRARDSVILTLPAEQQGAVIRARLAPDGQHLDGTFVASHRGQFHAAREGLRDARAFAAAAAKVVLSRRKALDLATHTLPPLPATGDPDSARLVTSDIPLFWKAVDAAPSDSLADHLERDYLERASVGVRDFIAGRIMSAEDLAAAVRALRPRYDSARAATAGITNEEPAIRAAFRRLKAVYAGAVFPDVYFVVGRFNSGGTSSPHGLLIGAEMYPDPSRLPAIVAHELIHFQQHYPSDLLLEHAFLEGSADFVGEMISGSQINNAAHAYGMAHEHALWQEFRSHFDDTQFYPWMYGRPRDGRPNDLGYFIGYRIAQAYYARARDKMAAIRDIITGRNGQVRQLLAESGYDP